VIWKLVPGMAVGVLVVWTSSFQGEAGGWFYCSGDLKVDCRGCAHQICQASGRILVSSHIQADYKPEPQASPGKVCSHSPSRERQGWVFLLASSLLSPRGGEE